MQLAARSLSVLSLAVALAAQQPSPAPTPSPTPPAAQAAQAPAKGEELRRAFVDPNGHRRMTIAAAADQVLAADKSGRAQFMVVDLASSQPQVKAGRLRALALTGSKRTALAPDLPTVEETLKIKDFDLAAWTGLFGPANLPADIVSKLSDALQKILNKPEIRERMQFLNDVGVGYLALHRSAATLPGGEG